MSALDQLVRLHTWTLDDKRRQAAELDRLAEKLRGDLARLEADFRREQQTATQSLDMRQAFTAYTKVVQSRRSRLERSIAEVEKEMARIQAEIMAAFQELKTYEQAQMNRDLREKNKLRRREQAASDELGLEMYQRRR